MLCFVSVSWERRWRDMVVAGGATLAVGVGCGGSEATRQPDPFCCNANGDPCCPHLYCGEPMTTECSDKLACEAEGGTYSYLSTCSFPSDAGPAADAAPEGDAPSEVIVPPQPGIFCCNANGDPCCQYLHCGGALTADCLVEMACEADGGTYVFGTSTDLDGNVTWPHCTLPPGASPVDATPDGEPGDSSTD
jgi:hypothetical protein